MTPSKEMVQAIVETLNNSELGVRKLKQFGSSLDPEKFGDKSDVDFLAVVASIYPLEYNPLPPDFVLEDLSPVDNTYLFRHRARPETSNWDQGREIHLLVAPEGWAQNGIRISNAFNAALSNGIKLFPPET